MRPHAQVLIIGGGINGVGTFRDLALQGVDVALVELEADFRAHVELTEGPNGLYQALRATAPHLAGTAARLTDEHTRIKHSMASLLTSRAGTLDIDDVDAIRESATTFLGTLSRHRQRGADLVYDAYQTDIGGET